ncbi:MAG: hypothetical protein ABJM39_05400 [Porticoccus sp.]|jgi:hypothetical protein|uniref:hypothetical protein n=1 Tax=Porticoccus sp. TaxID=2024853 RepID=UPI003299EB13|tara:strand:- start:289 stop:618 length:330 start_codon:yes stop_codon:yes gene_type:complete
MTDLEKQLQDTLRHSENELDSATAHRLVVARNSALNAVNQRRWPGFFIPVVSMAAISLVAVILVFLPPTQNLQQNSSPEEEFMLSEEIDLYEDMEFYSWLASDTSHLKG